ncbi:hypothetical protein BDB01DRAFT_809008 [Pilobolus umbonatus]|nr:hypothetical protein BDB01DRAFT_809008 [Pilobolus umbonatus]
MPIGVPFLNGQRELSIVLAEPVVLLRGLPSDPSTQVLRGEVELLLSKPMTASLVIVNLSGKSQILWPERLGGRNKMFYEKTVFDQSIILESKPEEQQLMIPGLYRWNFEFLIPNKIVETIEDDTAQVNYYITATVQRPGLHIPNLKCRKNILLLRTLSCSDDSLTSHALPSPSIISERKTDICDATFYIEKSIVSSGTQFPISIVLSPRTKHVFLESIDITLTEKRVYQIPEYGAIRAELHDYKLQLLSVSNMADIEQMEQAMIPPSDISLKQLRQALTAKNAHITLDSTPFQYRFIFTLPNCQSVNHTTYSKEINFLHHLKIVVTLSTIMPDKSSSANPVRKRCHIQLETPMTILDCRLKEDYSILPTYHQSMADVSIQEEEEDILLKKRDGFFHCPCYIDYKKTRKKGSGKEWNLIQQNNGIVSPDSDAQFGLSPPPPYNAIDNKH